jgi:hypothetical protein
MDGGRSLRPLTVAAGLAVLGWLNVSYYFGTYHADAASLRSEHYRSAQRRYDIQVAESRHIASSSASSVVAIVGTVPIADDAAMTAYLLGADPDLVRIDDPATSVALAEAAERARRRGQSLSFLFFPGNEASRAAIRARYPGGADGRVSGPEGDLLFYTYLAKP